jgi:hypothetical protein
MRMRTHEGMAIARAKGRLRGKAPKLSPTQRTVLLKLHGAGPHSIAELAELSSVGRATSDRLDSSAPGRQRQRAFIRFPVVNRLTMRDDHVLERQLE